MQEITLSFWDHIIFVFIGIIFPFISLFQKSAGIELPAFTSSEKRKLYISNSLVMWVPTLIILFAWWMNQRSFDSFWFGPPVITESVWVFGGIFLLIFMAESFMGIRSKDQILEAKENFEKHTPFMPAKVDEIPAFSFMAFTAGFTEEVIFRAFCMHYLYASLPLSGNTFYIIILIPALIFAIVHLYQGPEAVFKILAFGILFGFIYFYSQSLWLVIILHFLVDLMSGFISIFIIHRD